jgi:hypothetical protein
MRLTEYLLRRVGFRKAVQVMTFIAAWGIFIEMNGRPPVNVTEYSVWWNQSVPTGYREQERFRLAFPEEVDPTAMWARILAAGVDIGKASESPRLRRESLALRMGAVALP